MKKSMQFFLLIGLFGSHCSIIPGEEASESSAQPEKTAQQQAEEAMSKRQLEEKTELQKKLSTEQAKQEASFKDRNSQFKKLTNETHPAEKANLEKDFKKQKTIDSVSNKITKLEKEVSDPSDYQKGKSEKSRLARAQLYERDVTKIEESLSSVPENQSIRSQLQALKERAENIVSTVEQRITAQKQAEQSQAGTSLDSALDNQPLKSDEEKSLTSRFSRDDNDNDEQASDSNSNDNDTDDNDQDDDINLDWNADHVERVLREGNKSALETFIEQFINWISGKGFTTEDMNILKNTPLSNDDQEEILEQINDQIKDNPALREKVKNVLDQANFNKELVDQELSKQD